MMQKAFRHTVFVCLGYFPKLQVNYLVYVVLIP